MKTKKNKTVIMPEISPIFEKKLKDDDCGIFGFTVTYSEDKFENIICHYTLENHSDVLTNIEHKRQAFLDNLNIIKPIISKNNKSNINAPQKGVSNGKE